MACKLETMDASNLTYPDDKFNLSLMTFFFSALPDDVATARYILRTLKHGGTSVVTIWETMPWHSALEHAHHKTRGADEPMAPSLSKGWYKKVKLQHVGDAG